MKPTVLAISVTGSRLISAPLFSFFFVKATDQSIYTANRLYLLFAIIFVILIELSDALDGAIARSRGEVTKFGKIFDPICDSVSRQTVFCTFMYMRIIPLWMFLIFLYRDAILSLIRIFCAVDGTVLAAKIAGKLKAILQGISIFIILFIVLFHSYDIAWIPETVWGMHLGFWVMLLPTFFTVLSMFDYLIPSWPILKRMMIPEK